MNHGGNDQAATRDVSASQKQLVSDAVESNMATKKGKQISAYPKWILTKLTMIKEKQAVWLTKTAEIIREKKGLWKEQSRRKKR